MAVLAGYIIIGLLLVLALWVIFVFNGLIAHRNRMREAWSGIEVQLKRRHDLIPRLVDVVSAYAGHEKSTLEDVMEKRAGAVNAKSVSEASDAERGLGARIGSLIAVAEAYPNLKADEVYRKLMTELVETEDELQYARRYYNGAVREMNNAAEIFPSNMVAGIFGFKLADFFEVENAIEKDNPKVLIGAGSAD